MKQKLPIPEPWPLYEGDKIALFNLEASVALSVLWRHQDTIVPKIGAKEREGLLGVGNLYSKDGINLMIRNILAHPVVRRIVLTGPDLSGSGEALLALIANGIDDDHKIIGVPDAPIDLEIPTEAVELFRKHIEVIDRRQGKFEIEELPQYFLPEQGHFAEPQFFAERKLVAPSVYPSERSGIRIEGKKIADVWLEVLQRILRFGVEKPSAYGTQRELIDLVNVVTAEDTEDPYLRDWHWFGKKDLEDYYPRILTPVAVPDVTYTYGQRYRAFQGSIDQVQFMIDDLKKSPDSRRAYAVSWDPAFDPTSDTPPCVTTISFLSQKGELFLTATIRSNDMYSGWPINAFGLRRLQEHVARETGLKVGPMTTVSQSAHLYARDIPSAQKVLEEQRTMKRALTDFDPRGNLLLSVDREANEVVVHHQSFEGNRLAEYRGKTLEELVRILDYNGAMSLVSHATYIGTEIAHAFICLKHDIEYVQDVAPSLPQMVDVLHPDAK